MFSFPCICISLHELKLTNTTPFILSHCVYTSTSTRSDASRHNELLLYICKKGLNILKLKTHPPLKHINIYTITYKTKPFLPFFGFKTNMTLTSFDVYVKQIILRVFFLSEEYVLVFTDFSSSTILWLVHFCSEGHSENRDVFFLLELLSVKDALCCRALTMKFHNGMTGRKRASEREREREREHEETLKTLMTFDDIPVNLEAESIRITIVR